MAQVYQTKKIIISPPVLSQKEEMIVFDPVLRPVGMTVPWGQIDLASDYGFYPPSKRLAIELDRPTQHPVIGKGEGVHSTLHRSI
jgi:hypothetical protein